MIDKREIAFPCFLRSVSITISIASDTTQTEKRRYIMNIDPDVSRYGDSVSKQSLIAIWFFPAV